MPCWPSAPFWPLVLPDGRSFASFVHGWCDLPLLDNLFLSHRVSTSGFFSSSKPTTRVLALLLDFSTQLVEPLVFI